MKDKSEISKEEALRGYRAAGKGLFDDSPIIDLKHEDETTNADRLLCELEASTGCFKNGQVRVQPFLEGDGEMIAAALTMPTLLTYTDWQETKNGKPRPIQRDFETAEAKKVREIQQAVRAYCFEAADHAHRIHSESEKDWKRAFNTIDRDCLQGCVTFPSCSPSDATWIAALVAEGPDTLRADIMVFRRELKREIDGRIAALVAQAERTLRKIRGNTNAAEVAALVNAFAVDTVDDMAAFTDKAITYGFHSNSDDYEEYDASEIGVKLHEIAKLRFLDDSTVCNACEKAIDDFLYEIDRSCEVYRGSLINGLTENALAFYEWFTRKDPAGNDIDSNRESKTSNQQILDKLSRIEGGVEKLGDGMAKLVKNHRPKERKNLNVGSKTLKEVADLWNGRNADTSRFPRAHKRKISKADLFDYYRQWMVERGIKSVEDLKKVLDNARHAGLLKTRKSE